MSINDIERMAEGAERIAAYQRYVEENPNHPLGWFNLAVDLERAASYGEARKAIARVQALSPELYQRLPTRVRDLVGDTAPVTAEREVAGYRVMMVTSASESHLLYAVVRTSDQALFTLRRLLDISHANARVIFEAELAAPHVDGVARAHEIVADANGTPHLVLDRLHGDTLRAETHTGPLDVDIAVRLVRSAARSIRALHAAGGVHGDLRPDHALRDDSEPGDEQVRLLGSRTAGKTLPTPYGHIAWQTPEEAAGELVDALSDVYGIGLLLWHLGTGREPPPLADRAPLPSIAPDWAGLDDVVARATARVPSERIAIDAFIHALDELLVRRELPSIVGKWRLGKMLGQGTFGRVFDAENIDISGLRAAVKVLDPYMARDREIRKRFLNEASAASRIDHPNIVRVLDGGLAEGNTAYIAMERLQGSDLGALIAKDPLEPIRVARLGRQAASALAAAHAASIIHRDIKPSNLIVGKRDNDEEHLTVVDFGGALLRGEPTHEGVPFTTTGRLWGTPEYMSPEQWTSAADIDGRADIYSLGIVLWQSVAGRHPFSASTTYTWQQAHLAAPVPSLRSAAPSTPPALAALVERMMSKRRDDRPAEMKTVEAELAAISAPAAPNEPTTAAAEPESPSRMVWWILGAVLIAGAGIAIFAFGHRHGAATANATPSRPLVDALVPASDALVAAPEPVMDLELHPLHNGREAVTGLPAGVEADGVPRRAYRFGDRNGVDYLVFSFTDPPQALNVDLYAGSETVVHRLRHLAEPIDACDPSAVILDVVDATLTIADDDRDGIAEVTYGYHAGCQHRDPVVAKLVLLEGEDKYILRGEVAGASGAPDPAEGSWPPAFLARARSLWSKTAAP